MSSGPSVSEDPDGIESSSTSSSSSVASGLASATGGLENGRASATGGLESGRASSKEPAPLSLPEERSIRESTTLSSTISETTKLPGFLPDDKRKPPGVVAGAVLVLAMVAGIVSYLNSGPKPTRRPPPSSPPVITEPEVES